MSEAEVDNLGDAIAPCIYTMELYPAVSSQTQPQLTEYLYVVEETYREKYTVVNPNQGEPTGYYKKIKAGAFAVWAAPTGYYFLDCFPRMYGTGNFNTLLSSPVDCIVTSDAVYVYTNNKNDFAMFAGTVKLTQSYGVANRANTFRLFKRWFLSPIPMPPNQGQPFVDPQPDIVEVGTHKHSIIDAMKPGDLQKLPKPVLFALSNQNSSTLG